MKTRKKKKQEKKKRKERHLLAYLNLKVKLIYDKCHTKIPNAYSLLQFMISVSPFVSNLFFPSSSLLQTPRICVE
jgi:hypothetical protein